MLHFFFLFFLKASLRGDRVEILTGPDKGKQGYINYIVQVLILVSRYRLELPQSECDFRREIGLQLRG